MNKSRSQVKQYKPLKVDKLSTPVHCLITGFDAFEDHPFNPSEVIAQSMPAWLTLPANKIEVPVQKIVLPTSGQKSWTIMKSALRTITAARKPCVIIMLGLSGRAKNICLERFALNIRDGQTKDNAGDVYSGQTIDNGAPQALRTNTPLEEALKYLNRQQLPAEISNFCGTFVCNEIYFRTLHYFGKSRLPHLITFVHLPLPSSYGKALAEKGSKKILPLSKGKKNQLSAMRLAITALAQFNCQFLIRQVDKRNKSKSAKLKQAKN
jgi:pyroglutamyl-peptidase